MYNNYETSYEEYMMRTLGYNPNNYMKDTYQENNYYVMPSSRNATIDYELENLYPEVYKRVYPLVCQECLANMEIINNQKIEEMTENIYKKIEIDFKLETKKEDRSKNVETMENRNKNNIIRDLIKILILREILGGHNRPPFPGGPTMPPRPPFPRPHGPIIPR
ncbi:MAG: hypothetical protein HFJ53_00050 [Clostridia bacterium]|jgi:polyribonucleotide nucleotidyltransferase|nr:hypothetical protein [Clostridia bacterium]